MLRQLTCRHRRSRGQRPGGVRYRVSRSDGDDRDVVVSCGEQLEVIRVVGCHDPAAEADGGGDHQRVDGHLAASVGVGQEVTGDASHASAGGHDLCEASAEEAIDRFVGPVAAIELDEHRGGDAHWGVVAVCAPHRRSNAFVACQVLARAGQCGNGFAVED